MDYDATLRYLTSKIEERRTEIEQFLARGAVKDYVEYQKLCGFIQGLEATKQFIDDLASTMENADE